MFLDQIKGHQKNKDIFHNVLLQGKLGTAYLFVGSEGIGKQLFAKELIKANYCLSSEDIKPCNLCSNCQRINAGNFPDFHYIEPQGKQIKIEQIRSLIKEINYKPVETQRRAVLINDVQNMNLYAANTFLKTLEDSGDNTIFFLIAAHLFTIPQTIRSRCQIIKFAPLSTETLVEILDQKQIQVKDSSLLNIAAGSVARAIDLTSKWSSTQINDIFERFSALSVENSDEIFSFSEELVDNIKTFEDIISIFKLLFSDILRVKENLYLSQENKKYSAIVAKIASNNTLNKIHKKLEFLDNLELKLRFNLNKKISTERLLIELV